MIFYIFITLVLILRLGELIHSRRNERWLLDQGAIEYGRGHYPYIVAMHVLFFVSLLAEYRGNERDDPAWLFLFLYVVVIGLKVWTIWSLGKHWNTRIYRIPGVALVRKGPYKYLRHPNYMIVVLEIALIPLSFHLYYTALVFTVLNALMLSVRIKAENKVLTT